MEINRKKLIETLQVADIGLAGKPTIQQSDCYVFQNGEVITYNDEVACRTKCMLKITGAVNAKKLKEMLERSNDEKITFGVKNGRLNYKGKAKRGYIIMEKKISLPTSEIDKPTKWVKLPSDFGDAVSMISECAARSKNIPHFTCVHITSKWLEACDGYQAGRTKLDTPFKKAVLIGAIPLKKITELKVDSVSISPSWIHFRLGKDLVFSTLAQKGHYPTDNITSMMKTKGNPLKLPKGLKELVDRVSVFVEEDNIDWLDVKIQNNTALITGKCKLGQQTEKKKVVYKGKPLSFLIRPKLLRDLSSKNNVCQVTERFIKIQRDNFVYITSLWVPKEKERKEE
jgi:DNA polymerase III sliding clamp (beta) subunit (PCNA family)